MNPLQRRLASLRTKLRLLVGWRGICALFAVVVGCGLIACLADWFLELPGLLRAMLLVGILTGAGVVLYRLLLLPMSARCDDLSLALQVEGLYPELNDGLASTVQFLQQPDDSPAAGSRSMRQAAIQKAMDQSRHFDFGAILDRRGLLLATVGALVAGGLAAFFLYRQPEYSEIAIWRLADPFGNHTWTKINLEKPPHLIAEKQPFFLKGKIEGIVPEQAELEVEGTLRTTKPIPLKKGSFVTSIDMTQQKEKFRFRLRAGDAVYPPQRGAWHEVKIMPPPKMVALNGIPSPQIELRYPEYTDLLSPARETPGTMNLSFIAGTQVTFRAAFDRALEKAWIEYTPENPTILPGSTLAVIGQTQPLDLIGALGLSETVWGRVPARFESDQHVVALEFMPWVTGTYTLHVEDRLGLPRDFVSTLQVLADPAPMVNLQKPATSMSVHPDAEVAFKIGVNDERFAVRSVFLEFRRKDSDNRWLDEGPSKLLFYDHAAASVALAETVAALTVGPCLAAPKSLLQDAIRLRPRDLDLAARWALNNRFKEGDIVVMQVGADDFCNIFPGREPGRSHEIELRIVAKQEIAKMVEEGLGQAQQELVRVQQLQDEALNLVKEIQEKKNKNEVNEKDIGKLIDAAQLQKQIQDRLGQRPDEGLRNELAKLQQLIKDNKLPASEAQDLVKTLKNELDRLTQEELQQIVPNLVEALKDIATADKTKGENPKATDPKSKDPKGSDKGKEKTEKAALDKAQDAQQQTKKAIDELAKFLDPFASLQLVKGKTREILNKQKELLGDTDKLAKQKEDLKGKFDAEKDAKKLDDIAKAIDDVTNDLAKKVESQSGLADKTQDLVKMMQAAQEKRAKEGDKDAADKLKDAAKIANKDALPEAMREAAKDMAKMPQSAMTKQGENVKTLEKMMAALDKQKDDEVERLQKKQKNAADAKKNLDNIAEAQERLQKKVKDAGKIENAEEREKELKRLGEDQKKLAEKAKEAAWELARLQEEKASKEMHKAGQEMEKAADKLAGGENPEENQDEALQRIEEAQAKVQEFQEELAREQLAKIADRLKALKERQDAAVERSKVLQKKVVDRKKWSTGLLDTLDGDIQSQKGLAEETRSLMDKIKEAKVFAHIFDKAAKAMDEAAKSMEERKAVGKDRRFAELEKDELVDEEKRGKDVEKQQTLAAGRLQRLLDSLKNDPKDVAKNDGKKKDDGGGAGGKEEEMAPVRPGDGIPPLAQLKALRAEQIEINDRTKEFAKVNPDANNLTEEQRRELEQLQAEQGRLQQLFQEMTTARERKGDAP